MQFLCNYCASSVQKSLCCPHHPLKLTSFEIIRRHSETFQAVETICSALIALLLSTFWTWTRATVFMLPPSDLLFAVDANVRPIYDATTERTGTLAATISMLSSSCGAYGGLANFPQCATQSPCFVTYENGICCLFHKALTLSPEFKFYYPFHFSIPLQIWLFNRAACMFFADYFCDI